MKSLLNKPVCRWLFVNWFVLILHQQYILFELKYEFLKYVSVAMTDNCSSYLDKIVSFCSHV